MSATVIGDYGVGPAGGMPSLNDYISFWKLEDLTDLNGVNDLTNTGTVTFAAGKLGNAANFTTSSQRLTHIDNASLSVPGTAYTWALWVKVDNTVGERGIFGKNVFPTSGYYLRYETGFQFVHMDGGQKNSPASSANLGVFCFIVCWYDKTAGEISLQVNNETALTTTGVGDSGDDTTVFCIGAENDAGSHPLITGLIDAVGFWKRVLTAAERTYLYNSGTGREAPF